MNEIDKQGRTAKATATFPAIIQIQAGACLLPTSHTGKRRITRLLDHPAAKAWALFSWLLVIVGVMMRQRAMAMVVSVVLIAGLLVGLIEMVRWLFSRVDPILGSGSGCSGKLHSGS
jgi:hypothetical protein